MTADTAPAFERGAWSGWRVILVFVLAQLAFVAAGAITAIVGRYPAVAHGVAIHGFIGLTPTTLFASVLARTVAVLAVIFGARRWLSRSASPESFGFVQPSARLIFQGILAGIVLLIISGFVTAVQTKLLGSHPNVWSAILASHHGSAAFLLDVSQGAVITPFAEELMFRGFVFAALVQRTPVWFAVILSAALFAAWHFELVSFAVHFVTGAGLALLYYRTRNLWSTIAAHGTINGVVFSVHFMLHP